MKITSALLQNQGHFSPVLETLARRFQEGGASWRQSLAVEGTPPFFLEVTRLGNDAAVAVITRNITRHLSVAVASAAGSVDVGHTLGLQTVIEKSEGVASLDGVFYWLTDIPPPLAALVTWVCKKGRRGYDDGLRKVTEESARGAARDAGAFIPSSRTKHP